MDIFHGHVTINNHFMLHINEISSEYPAPDRQLFRGSAATIPGKKRQKNDRQPRLGCQNIQRCYENDEKWMLTYLKLEI